MSEGFGVNFCNNNKGIWENFSQSWKNPGSTEDRKGDILLLVRAIAIGIFRALSYLTLVVPLAEIAFLATKSSRKTSINSSNLNHPNTVPNNRINQNASQVKNQVELEPPKVNFPNNRINQNASRVKNQVELEPPKVNFPKNPQEKPSINNNEAQSGKVKGPHQEKETQYITLTTIASRPAKTLKCTLYKIKEKVEFEKLKVGSKIKLTLEGKETLSTIVHNEELSYPEGIAFEDDEKTLVGIGTVDIESRSFLMFAFYHEGSTYGVMAQISENT